MRPPERIRGPARAPAADRLGDDRGTSCSPTWPLPQDAVRLRRRPGFHRLTERLHQLGPRPVGELLFEVAAGRDLLEALEEYSRSDPAAVELLEARDWPPQVWGLSA
jgi:hypothetical protein